MVELALILPVLLILVFGITEFGRYLYLKNSVTQAAREGARKAAVTNPWVAGSNGSEKDISDFVKTLPSMNNATVTTVKTAAPSVSVTVRNGFRSVMPNMIPIFSKLTSISAQTTMRYE